MVRFPSGATPRFDPRLRHDLKPVRVRRGPVALSRRWGELERHSSHTGINLQIFNKELSAFIKDDQPEGTDLFFRLIEEAEHLTVNDFLVGHEPTKRIRCHG